MIDFQLVIILIIFYDHTPMELVSFLIFRIEAFVSGMVDIYCFNSVFGDTFTF